MSRKKDFLLSKHNKCKGNYKVYNVIKMFIFNMEISLTNNFTIFVFGYVILKIGEEYSRTFYIK